MMWGNIKNTKPTTNKFTYNNTTSLDSSFFNETIAEIIAPVKITASIIPGIRLLVVNNIRISLPMVFVNIIPKKNPVNRTDRNLKLDDKELSFLLKSILLLAYPPQIDFD